MKILYVEHETDTAHRLSCHEGKCWNLHGHRYKFVLGFEVKGSIESKDDFQDFYDLKKRVREKLDGQLDHATVLKGCNENRELIRLLQHQDMKVTVMADDPTVEAMVDELRTWFPDAVAITIYETPTNYCTWTKGAMCNVSRS